MAAPLLKMTYQEYLDTEATSPVKREFLRGEVWDMTGGTPKHALLQTNLARALGNLLSTKPCQVYSADLRVRVEATARSAYPDLTVVCGKREVASDDSNAVTNPIVLIEVLSAGTEAGDRGEKFAHYRRLPSLREYVLVNQDRTLIEVFRRDEHGVWALHEFGPGEVFELTSLQVRVPVDAVYEDRTG